MNVKPKAIFLAARDAVENAYSRDVRAKLSQALDFLPGFFDADALQAHTHVPELRQVQYAFSTWGMPALQAQQIRELFPALRAVFYAAGSVQTFARPFLECGIHVFSARSANAVPAAQTTCALVLLANKGFFQTLHRGGAGAWTERTTGAPYPGNLGTLVGVIGAGAIGTLVLERLRQEGLRTLVYDPFLSGERAAALGAEKTDSVQSLFSRCAVVTNHLPDNAHTAGMLDKSCFDRMADNGVFLNTGRGRQVVERDLIAALKACPARCAVLDVTDPEPPAIGSELYTLPNVFLSPHLAGSIGSEVARMGACMADAFFAYAQGRPTHCAVTADMLGTMA